MDPDIDHGEDDGDDCAWQIGIVDLYMGQAARYDSALYDRDRYTTD